MAEFYARLNNAQGSYALFKKTGELAWAAEKWAHQFDSAEDAKSQIVLAIKKLHLAGTRAYEEALAQQTTDLPSKPNDIDMIQYAIMRRSPVKYAAHPYEYYPQWMLDLLSGPALSVLDKDKLCTFFRIESRASLDDVLGSFELFYVRSSQGWLGGPRSKADWGNFNFHDSFSKAIGFSTTQAARDAVGTRSADYAIVKSSSAFTQVETIGAPRDDVSLSIRAACDARDITSAIESAASQRLADMRSAGGVPPSKAPKVARSRL